MKLPSKEDSQTKYRLNKGGRDTVELQKAEKKEISC